MGKVQFENKNGVYALIKKVLSEGSNYDSIFRGERGPKQVPL